MTLTVVTKKPRVLFLSFNVRYINPTRQLLYSVLSNCCDLVPFGPGYVPLDVVRAGPQKFVDEHGPFDLVVADEYSLLRDEVPDDQKHLHTFYYQAADFDPQLIHEGTRYFAFLRSFKGPRVITLLASDYYGFTADFIDQMEEVGDYYICWGHELMFPKPSVRAEALADQPMNMSIFKRWNDRYFDFVTRERRRVISTPFYVGPSEMSETPLRKRSCDWSILGADYEARVQARALIDGAGLTRSGTRLPYLFAGASKLGFHLYNKDWAIKSLNYLFLRAIRDARYGFTCGSVLRWAIRKYMEIPANGAVLVAEESAGFSALGFKHQSNALVCEARDILDAHAWLSGDPDRAQALANAGRELVKLRHSTDARAEQFADCFRRILAGTFFGAYWNDGNFRFRPEIVNELRQNQI